MAQRYFAAIQPGLEDALLEEVRELGGKRASKLAGGVEFDATNTVFYRTALRLRCANRLWLRLDEFRARDAPELFNKTKQFDWARLIPARVPVEVKAVSHGSRLFHTGMIADVVSDGIEQSLGREHPPNTKSHEPLTVLARVADDRCELSLDASGVLHYRRGWKESAVAAPMRESTAAAVLRLVGWEPGAVVVDPFCGSGTIIVEAAQRTRGIPAGKDREFAFHRWENFRPKLWDEVLSETTAPATPTDQIVAYGSDIEEAAVEAARHNAEVAGVIDMCGFAMADVSELTPPGDKGFVVTNPPWGKRLDDPGYRALDTFVRVFRERFDGWTAAVVAPADWQPAGAKRRARFEMGGVDVALRVISGQ